MPKDSKISYYYGYSINIICNLIQYKGIRFIEQKDKTNYVAKKEVYKFDIEKNLLI